MQIQMLKGLNDKGLGGGEVEDQTSSYRRTEQALGPQALLLFSLLEF